MEKTSEKFHLFLPILSMFLNKSDFTSQTIDIINDNLTYGAISQDLFLPLLRWSMPQESKKQTVNKV